MTDHNSGTSMGDLFHQRRAARKQQQQQQQQQSSIQRSASGAATTTTSSLRDIQAEQERGSSRFSSSSNNNRYSNNYDIGRSRGPPPPRSSMRSSSSHGQDSLGAASRSSRGRQSRGGPDRSGMPIEQGVIASIKDSFGFIHCADRPDELFFHFSEVNGCHPADLQIDDEVEFRVGQARKDDDKMAAYSLRVLEPGTIVWETEDEPGKRFQGLVERPIRSSSDRDGRGGGGGSSQMCEGTIRMLVESDEGEADGDKEQEEGEVVATTSGPLVRFTASDYTPSPTDGKDTYRRTNSAASSSSRGGGSGGGRLGRQDLVEFSLVTARRTGCKYARSITLIQSERERQRLAKEKEMLANATKEQGVVKTLKNDFGFLRSNRRREEVYFHYSNVLLPEDADENDFVLKEGQEMEFLVLTDPGGGSGRQKDKLSARKVQFLPAGSVVFHEVLAEGVTGVITQCPHPADWSNTAEMSGKVQLNTPIHRQNDDGTETDVTTVFFKAEDSPGGAYASNRDGSAVGLWVREGDTLLFDVVRETVDGTYCAFPTKHLKPVVDKTQNELETTPENGSGDVQEKTRKAIRLVSMSLAGRAEGVVHSIKENYGFVHCAERPVDSYFRLYELLPEELQSDLRRNMGFPDTDTPLELSIGSEIQFDLSLQGRVAIGISRSRHSRQTERDNLKAQRILLLPPSSIFETKVLAKDVRGVVTKEDPKQPLAGLIELDEELKAMTLDERHPLVAKLVDSMLDDRSTQTSVVFPDLQSSQEDHVVMNMVETRGNGKLVCSHIPVARGDFEHPGRLRISRAKSQEIEVKGDENAIEETRGDTPKDATDGMEASPALVDEGDEPSEADGSPQHSPSRKKKKKHHKAKPIKAVRYDKHSLMKELQNGMPPGEGDVVICDVTQTRRSGLVNLTNIRVIERKMIERGTALEGSESETKTSGVGIVSEVVASRNFGFISVLDEHATKRETLFFHTTSVVANVPDGDEPIATTSNHREAECAVRKGDEVKFGIGMGKNGKRVAINIAVVPKGTLDIPSKADKNACRGYILMEPSHTSLANTPSRHGSGSMHGSSHGTPVSSPAGGRWNNVGTEDSGKPASGSSVKEGGSILLLSDPAHMFSQKKRNRIDSNGVKDSTTTADVAKDEITESAKEGSDVCHLGAGEGNAAAASDSVAAVSGLCTRLSYKSGALAMQGIGSSSSTSGSNAPRRGDLVAFVKARSGKGVRDIRVVTPGAANLVRGRLENIELSGSEQEQEDSPGTATFIAATEKEEVYEIDLIEVVSCDVSVLKEKESVEGILHEGKIYGVCRTTDLYLESKLGASHKERPRLNLTVRKELKGLGGKIMAQSMMAKGPDGTRGFASGWTKRVSQYQVVSKSDNMEETAELATEETTTEAVEDAGRHDAKFKILNASSV